MKLLTATEILSANDLPQELVEVPEWGGSVYVRGLSGSERDQYEISIHGARVDSKTLNMANMRARLCALTICNENGERLFNDLQIEALGRKSAQALERVFDVARRLAGLTKADVDELAKELEGNPTERSSLGSA